MFMKHPLVLAAVAAVALSGCMSLGGPGTQEGDPPPRIVRNDKNQATWDNPGAFGPVPADLQAEGDLDCKSAGMDRAIGYHSRALDANGRPFPIGGYFCVSD